MISRTSRRGLLLTFATLAVVAMTTVPFAGAFARTDVPDDTVDTSRRVVTLDPEAVLLDLQAGRAVTLPTVSGEVVLTTIVPDTQEIEVIDASTDPPASTTRVSTIWTARSVGGVEATILATGTVVNAAIHMPTGDSWIEPVPGASYDERVTEYVVYAGGSDVAPPEGYAGVGSVDPDVEIHGPDIPLTDATSCTSDKNHMSAAAATCASGGGGSSSSSASTTMLTKTVAVYVDSAFGSYFGGQYWPDKVRFFFTETNRRFSDFYVKLDPNPLTLDAGFDGKNFAQTESLITSRSTLGKDYKMVYVHHNWNDVDYLGKGLKNKWAAIQTYPEPPSGIPSDDYMRVQITKHEFGHVGGAEHSQAWTATDGCCHRHRSIMYDSVFHHNHDCWSRAERTALAGSYVKAQRGTTCN